MLSGRAVTSEAAAGGITERTIDVSDKEPESIGRGIRKCAEALAFAALVAACTWMEVDGVAGGAGKLWVLVVIWAWALAS